MYVNKLPFALFICAASCHEYTVNIPNGRLRGEKRQQYIAFEGIPYAEPPVGELRFEPPQAITTKWQQTRNATVRGHQCMHYDHFSSPTDGHEDCLFINVYTPVIAGPQLLPVIVLIHGGAHTIGNANHYREEAMMEKNFTFVSFNYRLGVLGFLSTESAVVPGNMGLKDQVMALEWIQQNIKHFNGDPHNVTLTGFSFGAASVHLHLMSNSTRGLFHHAISHSGTALNPWVFPQLAKQKIRSIAINIGCSTDTDNEMVECLKRKPVAELITSVAVLMQILNTPFSPFGAVVDGDFLAKPPTVLLQEKLVQPIPWLVSATETEGLFPAAEYYDESMLDTIEYYWNLLVPIIFDYNHMSSKPAMDAISAGIRWHYLQNQTLSKETFLKFVQGVTDRLYLYDIGRAVRLHQSVAPVYFYFYKFKAKHGVGDLMSRQSAVNLGVAHGEDILMLYKFLYDNNEQHTEEEVKMTNSLKDMYESFTATGFPMFGGVALKPSTTNTIVCNEILNATTLSVNSCEDFGGADYWSKINFGD